MRHKLRALPANFKRAKLAMTLSQSRSKSTLPLQAQANTSLRRTFCRSQSLLVSVDNLQIEGIKHTWMLEGAHGRLPLSRFLSLFKPPDEERQGSRYAVQIRMLRPRVLKRTIGDDGIRRTVPGPRQASFQAGEAH
jgi:hypothetical protein